MTTENIHFDALKLRTHNLHDVLIEATTFSNNLLIKELNRLVDEGILVVSEPETRLSQSPNDLGYVFTKSLDIGLAPKIKNAVALLETIKS